MGILLFALLAATAIGSSLAMVTHRNPVYSALYMVVTFATTAIMFLLLGAPFLAALQIIIYAGAIIVLFLFVIMFLNLKTGMLIERRRGPLLVALILTSLVAGELCAVVAGGVSPRVAGMTGNSVPEGFGSVESVAGLLFTRYLVPFEITSILLVVAMVGAVVLARREGGAPGSTLDLASAEPGGRAEIESTPRAAEPAGVAAERRGR